MWAGPLVGKDGKKRRKKKLEFGRKPFFPFRSCCLVCKIGVYFQCVLSRAGWEKQLLGTGLVIGDGHLISLTHVQSAGGTDRARRSKIMLGLSTSYPRGKMSPSFETVVWALCCTPLSTQGRRLDWRKETRHPRRDEGRVLTTQPHWQAFWTIGY